MTDGTICRVVPVRTLSSTTVWTLALRLFDDFSMTTGDLAQRLGFASWNMEAYANWKSKSCGEVGVCAERLVYGRPFAWYAGAPVDKFTTHVPRRTHTSLRARL